MFPSRVVVYRSQPGRRHEVTVLNHYGSGEQWGCYASGDTADEAEKKALDWTWKNVRSAAAKGSLAAKLAILELEFAKLCDALNTKSW